MPTIRAADTGTTGLTFVNTRGRPVARIGSRALRGATGEVELPRGDLAAILHEASRDDAEYVFGDSIATLDQDEDGVEVTFERGAPRRFDLVIGADGLHSTVRRLAFGPESRFVEHMGVYVATLPLGGTTPTTEKRREVLMHNVPGKAVAIHPAPSGPLGFFAYRHPAVPGFDSRDTDLHKRMLADAFTDVGWRVPDMLARVKYADDLYFDSVSRVRLDGWSKGRVAVLGDAASCVSLFGDGSTLAMSGAYTLAAALAAETTDHRAAFRRYEAEHRKLVDPKLRGVSVGASLLIPATRAGITTRNMAARLSPIAATAGQITARLPLGQAR